MSSDTVRAGLPAGNVRGRRRALVCATITAAFIVIEAILVAISVNLVTVVAFVPSLLSLGFCLLLRRAYGWLDTTRARLTYVELVRGGPFLVVLVWLGFVVWISTSHESLLNDQATLVALLIGVWGVTPAAYAAIRR